MYLVLKNSPKKISFNVDSRRANADTRPVESRRDLYWAGRFIDETICDQLRSRRDFQRLIKGLTFNLINLYQNYIRIILPSACRFWPTCSDYAKEAIVKYGFIIGLYKAAGRLLCCHPFSGKGGYDPLPP